MSTEPGEIDNSSGQQGEDQQVPAEDPAEGSTSPMNRQAGEKSQAEGDDDETVG